MQSVCQLIFKNSILVVNEVAAYKAKVLLKGSNTCTCKWLRSSIH